MLLALFIYASAPASGGHLNPMITFSAVLVGICLCPEAILTFLNVKLRMSLLTRPRCLVHVWPDVGSCGCRRTIECRLGQREISEVWQASGVQTCAKLIALLVCREAGALSTLTRSPRARFT